MSKGSEKVQVRLPGELRAEIDRAMKSANYSRREAEYNISSWIRQAICEKLNHLKRSKRKLDEMISAMEEVPGLELPE